MRLKRDKQRLGEIVEKECLKKQAESSFKMK